MDGRGELQMEDTVGVARTFVLQLERSLKIRRLYEPGMPPYRGTTEDLLRALHEATRAGDLTLLFSVSQIHAGKQLLIERSDREDAFFFPLYRDGLRELGFSKETTYGELDQLLNVFEADAQGRISPLDDTIRYLWRCDLTNVRFKAIDGIGDQEGGEGSDHYAQYDYRALINSVVARITNPVGAEAGDDRSLLIDADIPLTQSDFRYETTTVHRSFEDNPKVFYLSPEEGESLREEIGNQSEAETLERFLDILFFILADQNRPAPNTDGGICTLTRVLMRDGSRFVSSANQALAGNRTQVSSVPGRRSGS